MAAKYNMKLVWKKNFHDIFKEYEREHSALLSKMNALEVRTLLSLYLILSRATGGLRP